MTKKLFIKKFIDFIKLAMKLNAKKHEYGLHGLENETEDLENEDLKKGLRMVVDKVEPKIIDEIFSNTLSFEKNKYRFMYKSMIKRTVLGIQEGLNNRILFFILMSMADLSEKEKNKIEIEILLNDDD